jgi:hypothetical protein
VIVQSSVVRERNGAGATRKGQAPRHGGRVLRAAE